MDVTRTYAKYLSARIRAERGVKSIFSVQPNSLRQLNHDRLPAGGRLGPNPISLGLFTCRPKKKKNEDLCPCQDPTLIPLESPPEVTKKESTTKITKPETPTKEVKLEEPKPKPKCTCASCGKYIRDSAPTTSNDKTTKRKKKTCFAKKKKDPMSSASDKSLQSKPSKQSIDIPKCEPECQGECALAKPEPKPSASQQSIKPVPSSAKCTDYNKSPNVAKELCLLKSRLDEQAELELKQMEQVNELNEKVKQLSGTVSALTDKCQNVDGPKRKSTADSAICNSNTTSNKTSLGRKISSTCQFCNTKNLPVLSSMLYDLLKLIGMRSDSNVALTILLRADNIYHVNVRDAETGEVLGCMLVSQAGISEANNLGLFQKIITFFVADVRSSVNSKSAINGSYNFEFVKGKRASGGKSLNDLQEKIADNVLKLSYKSPYFR